MSDDKARGGGGLDTIIEFRKGVSDQVASVVPDMVCARPGVLAVRKLIM
jgi:hypothetical protein